MSLLQCGCLQKINNSQTLILLKLLTAPVNQKFKTSAVRKSTKLKPALSWKACTKSKPALSWKAEIQNKRCPGKQKVKTSTVREYRNSKPALSWKAAIQNQHCPGKAEIQNQRCPEKHKVKISAVRDNTESLSRKAQRHQVCAVSGELILRLTSVRI